MTMGTWFRDYMFYPISVSKPMLRFTKRTRTSLGENLGKRVPVYLSTLLVWLATGVWHGASWNFVMWGLLNGLVLIISEELTPLYKKFHQNVKIGHLPVYKAFTVVRTFCLMSLIRTLDIYPDVGMYFRLMGTAITNLNLRRVINGGIMQLGLGATDYIVAFSGVALLILIGRLHKDADVRDKLTRRNAAVRYCAYMGLLFGILIFGAYGVGYDAARFIYNQF